MERPGDVRIRPRLAHAEQEAHEQHSQKISNGSWVGQIDPVSAVKNDHHKTMRMSVLRGPNTSPSQPLGTSKAE